VGMQKDLKLDDAGRMGHAAAWSESTLTLFNRQESRLERTFYRALHELQRLRKEREANLALVCQSTPADPVGQVPDLPSSETNNIDPAEPPHNPSVSVGPEPPTPSDQPPAAPEAADMQ
jgi:hypothetical protein